VGHLLAAPEERLRGEVVGGVRGHAGRFARSPPASPGNSAHAARMHRLRPGAE
jgi:hypothetical protein